MFAAFRLWQGTLPPALIWQDSKDYEAIGSQSLGSSGFWFGGRPPLIPLFWKIMGSPQAFVAGQTVLSVAAWGYLAWTVGTMFPVGWRRSVSAVTVLAFGTVTPIALWDRSVLSESLAMSGLALLFALAIRLAQRPTVPRAAAFVGAAFFCALARDTEIVLPAILGVSILVFAFVRRRSGSKFKMLLATACALLLAAGFCVATVVESGRDALNVTDNLYVRVFPYPARVAWFASHGMPEQKQIDQLADTQPPPVSGTAKAVFPNLHASEFARLDAWINGHGASTYALWMITHPWFVVLEPLRRPERTFNDGDGNIDSYAALNRVTSGLTPVLWPSWVWLEGVVAVTLVVVFGRELRPHRAVQVIMALGLLGVAAMLVAWNGDGQEATRHTIEGLAEIHLAVLIMFLYAVLAPRDPGRAELRSHSGAV
jgi:hypothetical protein